MKRMHQLKFIILALASAGLSTSALAVVPTTGSCASKAVQLSPSSTKLSRTVSFVQEVDDSQVPPEYTGSYCYNLAIPLSKGSQYTFAVKFINDKGGPSASNFYQIEKAGELLPAEDKWMEFNGEKDASTWRYRREHSHLTIGMWATAAMAVGEKADRIAFSEEMGKFYEGGDYFGLSKDTSGALEDTLHNEMYFDQFLAWFGTSLMSGAFVNVIDAIDNPKEATVGDSSALTPPEPVSIPKVRIAKSGIGMERLGNGILFTSSEAAFWSIFDMNGHEVATANGKEFMWKESRKGVYMVKARGTGFNLVRKVYLR